ncbi:unnamed protein product, partial [Porites evermanni]
DDRCQSFNFVISLHMCEFNDRTKEAKPNDFIQNPDRFYIRRDANRGSIEDLPVETCKEIKASEGQSIVSDKYWLYNDLKSGTTRLAYCDMEKEGKENAEGAFFLLECQLYSRLLNASRNVNYVFDKTFNCDSQIAPGWKRFEDAAGTRMPTSCPATHRCGTHSPGWINGTNPQVEDGEVLRKELRFLFCVQTQRHTSLPASVLWY